MLGKIDKVLHEQLQERIGDVHLRQRLVLEVERAARERRNGRGNIWFERLDWIKVVVGAVLRLTGLYGVGYRNFLDVRIVHNDVFLKNLPQIFDGYRVLQVSDLHADLDPKLTDVILERLGGLDYDLAVVTGDYLLSSDGNAALAMQETCKVVRELKAPAYGILGNHDLIAFVPELEDAGMRVLLNESVPVDNGKGRIYLSGVDDPHYYKAHNLHKTQGEVPVDAISILLAHSPVIYCLAAAVGYDLMLSGHTHGGQICLPGRIAILSRTACPRRMVYGPWQYREMQGYTTAGAGASGVPVRFFCPPEIVIHTLRSENKE